MGHRQVFKMSSLDDDDDTEYRHHHHQLSLRNENWINAYF